MFSLETYLIEPLEEEINCSAIGMVSIDKVPLFKPK